MTEKPSLVAEVNRAIRENGTDVDRLFLVIDQSIGQAITAFDQTGCTSPNFVRVIRALLAFQHGAERIQQSTTADELRAAQKALASLHTDAIGLYNLLEQDVTQAEQKRTTTEGGHDG